MATAQISEERRLEIIWLLEHRNDHLPMLTRRVESTPGFVNEPRTRTCPDCLANGRTMFGCETCGGSGDVPANRLDLVAAPDELPDDGMVRDPYAQNEKILPFGFDQTRHDQAGERDRQIARLEHQTRPARPEVELLEEANRRGYAWEEERRTMYRDHDFAALDVALDVLRAHDADAAHALNAVYVDGWMAEVGQITPLAEEFCERGLTLLSACLPDPLRTGLHPAAERQSRRRAA